MRLPRCSAFLPLLLAAAPAFAQTTPAQTPPAYQPQIDTFADQFEKEIKSQPHPKKKDVPPPRILVVDFPNRRGQRNVLGQQLADALATALQARLGPQAIISRAKFEEVERSAGITPQDLRSERVLDWQAAQAGASLLVTGRLARNEEITKVDVTLTSLADNSKISSATADLSLPADLEKLAHEPLDWPLDPHATLSCPSQDENKGVTPVKCQSCPSPEYTDAARKAHWQGTLLLKAAIDEQGQVANAITLVGAPYGLNERSIATVLQWQFAPATKDGQPVRTCASVEVSLRMY
jgi:TonB family protein